MKTVRLIRVLKGANVRAYAIEGANSIDDMSGDYIPIEEHQKAVDLLKEIEAWLSFNKAPNRENIKALKTSIEQYLTQNKNCLSCGKPFQEIDKKLDRSRPEDICIACFTSNA